MWNLLLSVLTGLVLLPFPKNAPSPHASGADRLIVARGTNLDIEWGEIRTAYGLYLEPATGREAVFERRGPVDFARVYLARAERRYGEAGPAGRSVRPLERATALAREIGRADRRQAVDARDIAAADSLSWTVYPSVDLIGAWTLTNLVLTGRVPQSILNMGGRLPGDGELIALRVESHTAGSNPDDALVEKLMPGQFSGPIADDGHYKVIRLDRRTQGAAADRDTPAATALPQAGGDMYGRIYPKLIEKLARREGWL